jgi:hypothetical protein
MRLRFLAIAPVIALAFSSAVQAQFVTVGPNVNITRLAGSQTDTAIAINRLDPNQIAVSSNEGPNGIYTAYTTNAGSTWNTGSFNASTCCSSSMGADNYGNIYMAYINGALGTSIARSTDGGANFSVFQSIPSFTGFSDHPELAVGPGPTAGSNSIFVRDTTGGSNRVISATSTGLGVTSPFTTITGLGTGNFGSTAVGPGGRNAFTSMTPAGGIGPALLPIRYDADGVGPGGYVIGSSFSTNVGGFRPILAQPNRLIDAQVALQYDSSGGANNGSLYMLYTNAPSTTSNDTDIVLRRSTDNGATFTNQIRINDDGGTNSQFFGRLAVDQVTGYLASVWYDARNSPGNNTVELWGSVSIDGGLNWAPNFKISDGISDGRYTTTGNLREFGDYISLDFYNGHLVTAWADSSNSTLDNPNGKMAMDVYFSNITVSGVSPVPEPPVYVLMMLGMLVMGFRKYRKNA